MRLTKERARSPLLSDAPCIPSCGFDGAIKAPTFTITGYGPWTQGKGHQHSYVLHLSKVEALFVIKTWISEMESAEARAAEREAKRQA